MKITIKSLSAVFLTCLFCSSSVMAQMFWNQAATFNGNQTSYISVPNSSTVNIIGSFTLEAWVNPNNISSARGIISRGGSLGTTLRYALRITNGRISVITNGSPRLSSKSISLVTANTWTHVSATYNSSSDEFRIFINGQPDTSSVVAGAAPTSNSDSLFIGISGASSGFAGQLDEVRIWNRALSSDEVSDYFRTSLRTSSGIYSGLVLSMPFQKENSEGAKFSVKDYSDNGNDGNTRNVSAIDQSFRPLSTITQNDNIEFDGNEDYIAGKDTAALNPVAKITIDLWIYPRTAGQTCNLVTKGNQYSVFLQNGIFHCKINGVTSSSSDLIPDNKWTRLTLTYDTSSKFYVDGIFQGGVVNTGGLTSGSDSIYIGGVPGPTGDFDGFIDELRIYTAQLTNDEIYFSGFSSVEKSNVPVSGDSFISYNLDGSLRDNAEGGGPKLELRNNAKFAHTGAAGYKPVTPFNRLESNSLPDGFYNSTLPIRLPLSGTSGSSYYTLRVNLDEIITDIDFFIAISHPDLSSITITMISPDNDSIMVCSNLSPISGDNNLVTVFNDQADSSFTSGKYASFHTEMKPMTNMNSVFAGKSTLGNWRFRIADNSTGGSGYVNRFSLRFNNRTQTEYNLTLTNFIQGFYNASANSTLEDTIKLYLRNSNSPYEIVDSCKRRFSTLGVSLLSMANALPMANYYLNIVHRNSIQVWSSGLRSFVRKEMSFLNHTSSSSSFGNNLIQVDNSPVRFAMYGGDVNQDGIVDAADAGYIDNDASNFVTGHVSTDLTGDETIDASDAAIADNNASNFVAVISP